MKLVKATRGSQEAGFVQPLTEAFAIAEYKKIFIKCSCLRSETDDLSIVPHPKHASEPPCQSICNLAPPVVLILRNNGKIAEEMKKRTTE